MNKQKRRPCIVAEQQYGNTQAPALLLLHGFGGSHLWWSRILDDLAQTYHVYALDLQFREPLDMMARELLQWIRQKHLHQVSIIGHSLGALLAQHLAVQASSTVEQLILANPALALPERSIGAWLHACREARTLSQNPPPKQKRFPSFSLRTYRMVLRALREPTCFDLATPTLIVWGCHDPLFPLSFAPHVLSMARSAQFSLLEGGHTLMYECPASFTSVVLRFLAPNVIRSAPVSKGQR